MNASLRQVGVLALGDAIALALVTLAGFAFHRELGAAATARFAATFLPFFAAWLASAGVFGALDPRRAAVPKDLWRPCLAALIAAPLGTVLRSAWLHTPPVPIFVAVMAATTLLGLAVWRGAYLVLQQRARRRLPGPG